MSNPKASVGRPTDLELMMLADGELDEARAREVAAFVAADPLAQAKIELVGEVGRRVRTQMATEVAEAEADLPEFADMWSHIESRLGDDIDEADAGVPARSRTSSAPPARLGSPIRIAPPRMPTAGPPLGRQLDHGAAAAGSLGLWASSRAWLSDHRGHLLSGLVSAGVVAALMLWMRPPVQLVERGMVLGRTAGPIDARPVAVGAAAAQPCGVDGVRALPAALPEVEDFEVYDGTGMVFTLPSEGEGDSSATVIWIDKDNLDKAEAPI